MLAAAGSPQTQPLLPPVKIPPPALPPTSAGVGRHWPALQPADAPPRLVAAALRPDAPLRRVPAQGPVAVFPSERVVSDIRWQSHSNTFPSGAFG